MVVSALIMKAGGSRLLAKKRFLDRLSDYDWNLATAFVLQDPRVVVSALMKLAGGSPSLAKELNVDAFLRQVRLCICDMHCLSKGNPACLRCCRSC